MKMRTILSMLFAAALAAAGAAEAKTLRFAGPSPILTLDPHSSADYNTLSILLNVYDTLVGRDQNLDLEPALATRWEAVSPTVWRFTIRQGVKFAEGQPLTAEDVKFSIDRANPKQTGMFTQFLASVDKVTAVDEHTVEFTTKAPDPLLPRWLTSIAIISKDWAMKHGAAVAPDLASGREQYTVRNANGTGPFRVERWDASSGTVVLRRSDTWWGKADGNVTEAIYTPIASAPTRIAALLSGNTDLVIALPIQDIPRVEAAANLKVLKRPELRHLLVLMSPQRDVPLDMWDKAGAPLKQNPWRDLRVRRAVAHAVNRDQIVARVMQGNARPSGIASMPGLADYQEDLDVPLKFDPDLSKKLLAEAGYPDGFKARLRCTNDRYPNDEAICRALASMLARIGIDVEPSPEPWSAFVKDLVNLNIDFALLAAAANGQTTYDMLQGTWMTRQGPDGNFNWLRWSDKEFDAAVTALKAEFDPAKRKALTRTALEIARDRVAGVFLHQQVLTWGVKKTIDASIRPDAYVVLKVVKVE
jgi:peptide/nickel transport system substrate-binding protein